MSCFNCDFCESQNFLDGPTDNIIPIPTLNPVILGWPFLGIRIFRITTQVLNSFLTQSSQIRPCNAIIYTVIKCKLVNSDPVDSKFVLIQTTYTWSHLILLVAHLLFKLSPPFEKRSLFLQWRQLQIGHYTSILMHDIYVNWRTKRINVQNIRILNPDLMLVPWYNEPF